MEKFVPYEKLSKKKKKELDSAKRTVWTVSPVTRKPENPKAYNRKKAQKWKDDSGSVPFALPGIGKGVGLLTVCKTFISFDSTKG